MQGSILAVKAIGIDGFMDKRSNTIIYLESSQSNIFLMELIFNDDPVLSQYDLVTTQLIEEAINLTSEYQLSLAIIDNEIPYRASVDFIDYLKTSPLLSKIPIFVVSSDDSPKTKRHLSKLGCNEFILKPYSIIDFKNKIIQYLTKTHTHE